ncbi:hypothetical protein HX021_11705 [Sphingobacterium sp. N143]|uniref:hypothetical protein n=1 Tax=Sphingobacterium sp. N143 TaxID=2746727 RepID=UPI002578EA2F|nr:hypothetical protein [Sphingobacterium sp. N143]MDM1294946.1 hypothetical protein [Sphingobacterium sp. N143]
MNMIRIGLLSLLFFCLYFAYNRQVLFAFPIGLDQQDTIGKEIKDTLQLDIALITRKKLSAKDKLDQKKEEYRSIYFWGDTKNMVTLPHQGGIAVNLNKLYNKFSRKGRNSRKMQRDFEREYELDLIYEEWLPLTQTYTALSGDSLEKFRIYFRPSLKWLNEKTNYEKVAYIQECLKSYKDSVDIIHHMISIPKSTNFRDGEYE